MSQCEQAAGHDTKNCCADCHAHWEAEGEYMNDGFDPKGYDLHVCCTAANTSREFLAANNIQKKFTSKNRE